MIIPHQPAVALPWLRDMIRQVKLGTFQNIQEYWPAPAFLGIPINNSGS